MESYTKFWSSESIVISQETKPESINYSQKNPTVAPTKTVTSESNSTAVFLSSTRKNSSNTATAFVKHITKTGAKNFSCRISVFNFTVVLNLIISLSLTKAVCLF